MEYMYITNNPYIAQIADTIGIDRVWIDLEKNGKEERQKKYDSVKSQHNISDISQIKNCLKKSKLQVRVNPINLNSKDEIEQVLSNGADFIMLPYYKTLKEIELFLSYVKGRATTILLLETKEANQILEQTLRYPEIHEIHIGLNDLHLSYEKSFMFQLLGDGTVERICQKIHLAGIPYGFGGIARLGQGAIPAEYILAEHYRLGSTRAILSRSFFNEKLHITNQGTYEYMKSGLEEIRAYERQLSQKDTSFFNDNHIQIKKRIEQLTLGFKGGT